MHTHYGFTVLLLGSLITFLWKTYCLHAYIHFAYVILNRHTETQIPIVSKYFVTVDLTMIPTKFDAIFVTSSYTKNFIFSENVNTYSTPWRWMLLYSLIMHRVDRIGTWRNITNAASLYYYVTESSWSAMAHADTREGKWRGNWRTEWVASTLHTTSEHGVSNITKADAHTSAASSRLNWRPRWFKWTRPFRWKTKPGFCTCAITFQTQSTTTNL